MSGYQSAHYATALAEFGRAIHLAGSDGWLLEREIAGAGARDVSGCYPFFSCRDWAQLGGDLDRLAGRFAAVSMVVDPFCGVGETSLAAWFPEVCWPYKDHYVVDFSRNWRQTICRHHRRNIRSAAKVLDVEWCDNPLSWLDVWTALYEQLIDRHRIRGIARFSRESFARQFQVPGTALFRAVRRDESLGMLAWYRQDQVAYYHLGAFAIAGYESGAAFALFDAALSHFAAEGVRWAALGGGAGWRAATDDGLTRFKQGWSNERRTAWFCGRVLDRGCYERLVAAPNASLPGYFPGYRQPEAA